MLLDKFKNRSTSGYWKQHRDESISITDPAFLNMERKSRKCHSSQAPSEEHVLLLWGRQNTWPDGPVLCSRKQFLILSCSYVSSSLCCGSINAPIACSKHQLLPPCSHSFCCNSPSWTGTHGPWMIYLAFCYVGCFFVLIPYIFKLESELVIFFGAVSLPQFQTCEYALLFSFFFRLFYIPFFPFTALLLWQWLAWLLLLTPNPPMAE